MKKKRKNDKLFEKIDFGGKRAKPSEIAGKSPFLVSGLSYFSLHSGYFCLTSVLIVFICFSSVCLLFFFCLDSGFLIQGVSVLILPVLLLSCNEQMGIPETGKSRYPKKAPQKWPRFCSPSVAAHQPCSKPTPPVLQNRWPRSLSAQIRPANLRTYMLGKMHLSGTCMLQNSPSPPQ